ncbi:hypothetical protein KA529_01745 [Candidatus Saccharibacteria bacterium]|nr:hypothetical protein [Candidatus Saccharibacteria bacterium]
MDKSNIVLKKTWYSSVYWFHFFLMTGFFFSGFFLDLRLVVLLYIVLEAQIYIFNGCSLTRLQQVVNPEVKDQYFIPQLMERFFRFRITENEHGYISFVILVFPVCIALIKSI